MDHTHGDSATMKSFHQARISARRTIFCTRVLLALLTGVVELSLCTGITTTVPPVWPCTRTCYATPEILARNETVAWQAAIWYWMTPTKSRTSPHQAMVDKWVPSKNDTLAQRQPGFGMTINIKASDGEDTRMRDRIRHFVYFLQGHFRGVDPGLHLDCGTQGVVLLDRVCHTLMQLPVACWLWIKGEEALRRSYSMFELLPY